MQDANRKAIQAYVELLDEGSEAWRPTQVEEIGNGLYKLLPTSDYDPTDEAWAFLPGDIVRVEEARFMNGATGLVVRHPDLDVIRIDVEQEQSDVFGMRRTLALNLGNGTYRILATPHYNPREQHWKFPPGSIVRLQEKRSPDGFFTFLVPYEKAG